MFIMLKQKLSNLIFLLIISSEFENKNILDMRHGYEKICNMYIICIYFLCDLPLKSYGRDKVKEAKVFRFFVRFFGFLLP